jgi:hypothetical protein
MMKNKLKNTRRNLEIRLMAHELVKLASSCTSEGLRIDDPKEFRYRSVIYTLFYANLHSLSWISNFENRMLVNFPYPDIQIILRGMFERLVNQSYIATDPERLAEMFVLWQLIENRKQSKSINALQSDYPESTGSQLMKAFSYPAWQEEDEIEYQDAVRRWENLVEPKQSIAKARSWSGKSLIDMVNECDAADLYVILYRSFSWYTHGLVHVSDYYLRHDSKGNLYYSSDATDDQRWFSYFYANMIFSYSFGITGDFLHWNIDERRYEIINNNPSLLRLAYFWIRNHLI